MSFSRFQIIAIVISASCIGALMLIAPRLPSARRAPATYYVGPAGSDQAAGTRPDQPLASIQRAVDLAGPGDTVSLAPGVYFQDLVSRRAGTAKAPIVIKGPADAVLKGAGSSRIVEINHDYLTLDGFTIDGQWDAPARQKSFREKLLYVVSRQAHDGVTGLRVLRMTFKNAGGECLRLRYFAQHNEVGFSRFEGCGVHDFRFKAGKRNGEAIYIGTAPEQRDNGENPTADPDESNQNWVHDNRFNTQGNECVDIKEASSGNIVERNSCTGQKDPNSAGFDARGSGNIFRYNTSFGNIGAGIRLGGDGPLDGVANEVYGNSFYDNQAGGVKLARGPQQLCGNTLKRNRAGAVVGARRAGHDPSAACAKR